jgi:hypothetical protein
VKRQLEDQLSGVVPVAAPETTVKPIAEAVEAFLNEKRVRGI